MGRIILHVALAGCDDRTTLELRQREEVFVAGYQRVCVSNVRRMGRNVNVNKSTLSSPLTDLSGTRASLKRARRDVRRSVDPRQGGPWSMSSLSRLRWQRV